MGHKLCWDVNNLFLNLLQSIYLSKSRMGQSRLENFDTVSYLRRNNETLISEYSCILIGMIRLENIEFFLLDQGV